MMREKSVIVLAALLKGTEIEIDGHKYAMCENTEGKKFLGVLCTKIELNSEKEEPVYLPHDITLAGFIKTCDELSNDKIFEIGANSVLQDVNRR